MLVSEIQPDTTDDEQTKHQYTINVPEPEIQPDQVDISILQTYFPLVAQETQMQEVQGMTENFDILLSSQDLSGFEQSLNSEDITENEASIDNSKNEN